MKDISGSQRFPEGKISKDDLGEVEMAIAADKEKKVVVIAFPKSVDWLAFGPDFARKLAAKILEKAKELDGK